MIPVEPVELTGVTVAQLDAEPTPIYLAALAAQDDVEPDPIAA